MHAQTPNGWTVIDRDAGVLSYTYVFDPKTGATANTFTARMADERLLVISPACGVSRGVFDDIASFGEVGAVVANNGFHHLGQTEWRKRFPKAHFCAPSGAPDRIAKKNPDVGAFEPLSALDPMLGPTVGLRQSPNWKCGEAWAWAKTAGGYVWFTSDVLSNMPELPKNLLVRTMFKLSGTRAGYSVFKLALKFTVKDRKAVLSRFLTDVKAHPPAIVVPGHGPIINRSGVARETRELVEAAI